MGRLTLPNRIIMPPLTRGRAGGAGIPDALVAEYYAQRASAGLPITEVTAVNREGDGWPGAPGLYTDALAAAQLAWQTAKVDLDDPAGCLAKFKSNRLFGWLMLVGMALAAV